MLDSFRENARSIVIQAAIAIIALVFIFSFGPASKGCGVSPVSTWAASVNGEQIPSSVFDQTYRNMVENQRYRRGGSYTVDDARNDNLREETLKMVVDRELVIQAGLRHGIWVSDAELAEEIRKAPQFHRDGRFDKEIYLKYVNNREGTTRSKFEERVRRDMIAQRMEQLALGSVAVSQDEIRAEFIRSREQAAIEYVRFLPSHFVDAVEVSEADVDAVLADRLEEVQAKYEKSRFLFQRPRGVQVRRLFVPVRPDATEAEESAARESLVAARAQLESGRSFGEVAAGVEGDAAAEPVWVELGRSPFGRTFEEAAFKLEAGERSDVLRDRLGFHLIEAIEHREAKEESFDEVKRRIATDFAKDERARKLAKDAAQKTLARLQAGESLATQWPNEGDSSQKPAANTTDAFGPMGGIIPGVGSVPHLSAAVFAAEGEGSVSKDVVEDQKAFFVFRVTERVRADLAELDEVRDDLGERIKRQRHATLRKAWLDELREAAKITENPQVLSYEIRLADF